MIISVSKARAQLFPLIQQVNQDQAPITITSNNGNAVLVSESEWEAILETAFLLRTASNRSHLEKSMAALELGKGIKRMHTKGDTLNQLLKVTGAVSKPTAPAKKKVTTAKPVAPAKKKVTTAKPAAKNSAAR